MKKGLLLLFCLLSLVGDLWGEGKDVIENSLWPWNWGGKNVMATTNYGAEDSLVLLPGWNLVAAPGNLSKNDNMALFEELKPFTHDRESMVYVQALLPLLSGEPLWFYSDGVQYVKLVHEDSYSVVRGLTGEEGWQLVGVGGKDDVVLNNIISVWQWRRGRWSLLEINDGKVLLAAGKGYFVFREKVESDGLPDDWKIRYFKTTDVRADDDADGDGLSNLEEYENGTDPLQADTYSIEVVKGVADKNETCKGDAVTITADAPAEDMVFDRWTADDVEFADATSAVTTFVMPAKNVTVTASYVKKAFTIEIANGVANKNEAFMGDAVTVTADAPAEGMVFDRWTSDDVEFADATSMTTSFVMPAKNVTVTASYVLKAYTIDVVNGVADRNEAFKGNTVTITADAPAEGMVFDRWTSDDVEIADATSAVTTFVMPARNVTVSASYVQKGFTINVVNGVASKNEAFENDVVTVTAVAPTEGVVFDRWTSDDVEITDATSETITFAMPAKNVTVTALYVLKTFTIEVVNGEASKNEAFMGEAVTITADAPPEGMAFDRWTSDDVEIADATSATASFVMPARNVTVIASYIIDSLYVVVDLSGGPKAKTYPVRYTDTPFNLKRDTCRTTELWLRKIPAGTFIMGSPADELGHENDEIQHEVTLTRNYYIGVFECTQKQWKQIMNTNPSAYKGDTRPVEGISYNMIRGQDAQAGAGWPTYDHVVDSQSFMGKLQEKTGLKFDLPTEAQWEYACRAGTTTALNSGFDLIDSVSDINMDDVGRYLYNTIDSNGGNLYEHTKVGYYLPNAWGLYDMHGNVYEWCLDWYSDYGSAAVRDPKGAKTGTYRIIRGGCWGDPAAIYCRSAYRNCHDPAENSEDLIYIGFRIALLP